MTPSGKESPQLGSNEAFIIFFSGFTQVLQAIEDNEVEKLYNRAQRADAIKTTQWPQLLSDFAKDPRNSRTCPGQERVRVAFKVYAPKYLLRRPREVVIKAFLQNHPDCEYSHSILNREFPTNVITGSARDLARNCCPIHSNAGNMFYLTFKTFML